MRPATLLWEPWVIPLAAGAADAADAAEVADDFSLVAGAVSAAGFGERSKPSSKPWKKLRHS